MFDPSAPHIIILLIVVLLLFGARRLPGAAKSLGESMHIFKRSVQGMGDDDAQDTKATATLQQSSLPVSPQLTPAQPAFDPAQAQQAQAQQAQSQQLADLQRQLNDLQRQGGGSNSATVGGTGAPMSEAQHGQQPF
jgi:sec-independent protein translocase protein TatA